MLVHFVLYFAVSRVQTSACTNQSGCTTDYASLSLQSSKDSTSPMSGACKIGIGRVKISGSEAQ